MKLIAGLWPLLLTVLATACAQIGVTAANFPTHFDGVTITRDIAFGPEDWQKLDIYNVGPQDPSKPRDVIVFYYGGRWETGSKADYRFVGTALAKRGFIVVIPDYRKYPQARFPGFVQDAAQSLAWTSRNITRYGGNPARLHLSGHSAGAHIASLLATDARYLKAEGLDRSKVIHDFAGLAGPYDFTPTDKDLIAMFGPPSNYPQMQATTFIDGHQPPMLLLWGDRDQYVGKVNIDRMQAAVRERGGCIAAKTYPGVDHIWLVGALSWLGGSRAHVAQDMTDFFRGEANPSCFQARR